jgi:ATPase subunit of ABC transporter with duplicated ATPase domains
MLFKKPGEEKKEGKEPKGKKKGKGKTNKDEVTQEAKKKKKKKKGKKNKKKDTLITENSLNQSLLPEDSDTQSCKPSQYTLQVDDLQIKKGQFVSVVGRVGSGKSTLISAILNEIDKVSGDVSRRGTVAYIPQTSWLRSATIRENILFERPWDE